MKYILIVCLALMAICFRSATDKETIDWTGTTQGENVSDTLEVQGKQDSIGNLHIHECIRISNKAQREMDSIDNYMRHWYAVCDTNSDGDIDDIE